MVMVDLACVKVSAASSPAEISMLCTADILRWDDLRENWDVAGMMETGRCVPVMVAVTSDADRFCSDDNC